jgi:hypothetical protein
LGFMEYLGYWVADSLNLVEKLAPVCIKVIFLNTTKWCSSRATVTTGPPQPRMKTSDSLSLFSIMRPFLVIGSLQV